MAQSRSATQDPDRGADPSGEDGRKDGRLESDAPGLSEAEEEAVEEKMKLRPLAVYEIVRQEGEEELKRPASSLWWSGIAAGLSIGFSVLTQATLRTYLPDAPWRPLVECWGYSVGFLFVILGRQQLFTEITLTATLPVIADPSLAKLGNLARQWAIVLIANVLGTAIFAYALTADALGQPDTVAAAVEISRAALEGDWLPTLLRAMVAGWLMATVVWLLPSAGGASVQVIVLITYLIALFHLTHIVAGSVEAMILVFEGERTLLGVLGGFYAPALIGNIIGGATLFSLISYAQVAQEMRDSTENAERR